MSAPRIEGFQAEQSKAGLKAIRKILDENPDILRIVELGTGHGGMSLHLGSFICGRGGNVLTIDRVRIMDGGYDSWAKFGPKYHVNFIERDVFNPSTVIEVSNFIQHYRAMILCDNGDKKREVELYAKILKKGDLLLAHDHPGEWYVEDLSEETLSILEPYRQEDFPILLRTLSMIRK